MMADDCIPALHRRPTASPLKARFKQMAALRSVPRKGPEALPDVTNELCGHVRQIVSSTKEEYDKVNFALQRKEAELEKLKLELRDIERNASAFGVQSLHEGIQDIERQIREQNEQTASLLRKTMVYEHIRKRLMAEKVAAIKSIRTSQRKLLNYSSAVQSLRTVELQAASIVRDLEAKLVDLMQEIETETKEWDLEIKQRQMRAKTVEQYRAQKIVNELDSKLAKHEELHRAGEKSQEQLQLEQSATTIVRRFLEKKLSKRRAARIEEERMYEEAFRSIGVTQDLMDSEIILKICENHASLEKEIETKIEHDLMATSNLHHRIKSLKAKLLQCEAEMPKRDDTLQRQILLHTLTTKVQEAEEEQEYLSRNLSPIQMGVKQLAINFFGNEGEEQLTVESVLDVLSNLESLFSSHHVGETQFVKAQTFTVAEKSHRQRTRNFMRITSRMKATLQTKPLKEEEDWELRRLLEMDNQDEEEVMDRSTIKRMADNIVAERRLDLTARGKESD